MSAKLRGEPAFESAYSEWFGSRWPQLRQALTADTSKVALLNPWKIDAHSGKKLDWRTLDPTLITQSYGEALGVELGLAGNQNDYELDLASVFAALALPVQAGHRFLDLCSAPGGKALAVIYKVRGDLDVSLNEMSNDRLQRLKAVCFDHLTDTIREKIRFTKRDGSRWPKSEGPYDAVLVDAPCSGERHLLERPTELTNWTLKRSKGLAIRQHALLCSAVDVTGAGGHVLYSTCTLSPLENDEVIERLLKRRKGLVQVVEAPLWLGERTQYGVQIFPDLYPGFGPIYYSLIQCLSSPEN